MSQEELCQEMRRLWEQGEERRRGTQLMNPQHLHVNQELVGMQMSWVHVQSARDVWHGVGCVPQSIQDAVDKGERQLTVARQTLQIVKSHGPCLATQFQGDPLLMSEEQTRLCSLVKYDKDRQALRKAGGPS